MAGNGGRTPLPDVDDAAVDAFWQRYVACLDEPPEAPYTDADCLGDSVELADELIGLILYGPKRATAGSVADYGANGIDLPQVGDLFIATDGRGQPRAVLRNTEVRIGPMSSVNAEFAWDEGEGNRTVDDWLQGHTAFFTRVYQQLGLDFHPDIPVVFERFEVVYDEG